MYLSEAIENGYNYKYCIDKAKEEYNLNDNVANEVESLMSNHKRWNGDDVYFEQFGKDLKGIVLK